MSGSGGAPQGAPPAFAPAPMSAPPPAFAPHVHTADLGALTVLLDLRHDRYLAAPSALVAKVAAGDDLNAEEHRLQRHLSAAGLLGTSAPRHWVSFWSACMWAAQAVASKRLDRAIDCVRRSRRRNGADLNPAPYVASFEAMRPWYPAPMVCLFDSLALMRFLGERGARSALVFGVRGMPFAAHCWVEDAGAPLNDEAAYCASFTPILRV